ncbi:integrase [Agrobacterium tumefaciens]|uniref:DUF6538 domain-containing protein n=1 Tax=Agrobacterium tumefaciens TaxID=358 RepID=UPI001572A8DE|nr:DUF6538 domain-containing protein [Agrobacterium tumefaciens]NTE66165.1 integrase [Agrobacterium tumefaciens]
MVLQMARPQRHPTTGIFQLRKRVPKHLIPLVGKKEEKISLGTRDPSEAKILHARALTVIETRWKQLSVGVISLSQKQAVAMSGEIYRAMVRESEDDPGLPEHRLASLLPDYLHLRPEEVKVVQLTKNDALFERIIDTYKVRRNDKAIEHYLHNRGYRVDEPSMHLLRSAVASAVLQAKEHLLKMSKGDYRPDPDAERFPVLDMALANRNTKDIGKYGLSQVFEDYHAERKLAAASYKKWKGIIAKVSDEVPDIRDLTDEWVVDWKDRLLKQGLTAVHVKDSYLASLRAVCTWAKNNKRIPANPVDGISVAVPKKIRTRDKEFTSAEAQTILRGSLKPASDRHTDQMKAAYRWVPWLCAYTGARVGEITQLRKKDVQLHGKHWLVWITPEAGTTKDGNPRFVALHPHLIEQGFVQFIRTMPEGPIFFDPSRYRGGTNGNPQSKKVGERLAAWVRGLGVTDTRIKPNHAWRHLFKTEARGVFMGVGARDYMQGHVPASEGEAYGGFKPHVLAHEIAKLPRFEVT